MRACKRILLSWPVQAIFCLCGVTHLHDNEPLYTLSFTSDFCFNCTRFRFVVCEKVMAHLGEKCVVSFI